jgi:hypothetical protein
MQPPTPRSYALAVPAGDYPRQILVPLYMDIHTVNGGAAVNGVAQAHAADLDAQGADDVRYSATGRRAPPARRPAGTVRIRSS